MDQITIKVWDKPSGRFVDDQIDAIISSGKAFGLHKRVYCNECARKGGWTITHLKTGAKLVHARGKEVGLEIMAALAPFEDILRDAVPYGNQSVTETNAALKSIREILMPYIDAGKAFI